MIVYYLMKLRRMAAQPLFQRLLLLTYLLQSSNFGNSCCGNGSSRLGNGIGVHGFVFIGGGGGTAAALPSPRHYNNNNNNNNNRGNRVVGVKKSSSAAATKSSTTTTTTAETTATGILPSWDDLLASSIEEKEQEAPVLTLYRDTNGWCPFCERVWLCVRAKNLPYRERLIDLRNKPGWFLELVPTGLVPAVLVHDDVQRDLEDDGKAAGIDAKKSSAKPVRRLIWESLDIMEALDEAFPSTQRLVLKDSPEYLLAREQATSLASAGVKFTYGARNASRTSEELDNLKTDFVKELDVLEKSLALHGGPFRLGSEFTGIDAEIVPTLERWRYQLPITHDGMDILDGRPHLQNWFDAMDSFGPYRDRVKGDAYSWAAVSSTFFRYFGGDEETTPKLKAAIAQADSAASELVNKFVDAAKSLLSSLPASTVAAFAREAATKLTSNHEAVIKDCTDQDPKSQTHVPRASDPEAADTVLRHVANILLLHSLNDDDGDDVENDNNNVLDAARSASVSHVLQNAGGKSAEAALAARTVATRICTPRDMSAPAAILLRGVLTIVADRLLEEGKV